MEINMKKTILFLTVILLMIGACGCGMKAKIKTKDMVDYINRKYTDDSFEFVSVSGGHIGSTTRKIIVKSEKYPNKEIRVICSKINGNIVYSDTYLNVKFEKETQKYLENALQNAFNTKTVVRYIPDDMVSMEEGTVDTKFDEYISDKTTYVYFSALVVLDEVDEDSVLLTIKNAFADGVVLGDIYFVDSIHEDSVNGNDAFSLIKEKKYSKSLFIYKEDVEQYKTVEWKD